MYLSKKSRNQLMAGGALAVASVGTASAAVSAAVSTALSDATADVGVVGGAALIAIVAGVTFKYIRRAL